MQPEAVETREDLARYLAELAETITQRTRAADNSSLASYLSGAAGWVQDMHGYFANNGEKAPEAPTWALVAAIFAAATVYE